LIEVINASLMDPLQHLLRPEALFAQGLKERLKLGFGHPQEIDFFGSASHAITSIR
jgi:hypothetical protein